MVLINNNLNEMPIKTITKYFIQNIRKNEEFYNTLNLILPYPPLKPRDYKAISVYLIT